MGKQIKSVFPFCVVLGAPVPDMCVVDREMLEAAVANHPDKPNREEIAEVLGLHERTLRRRLADGRPIKREQVSRLVERLGCSFGAIMRNPNENAWAERRARERDEAAAWPVPLFGGDPIMSCLEDIRCSRRRTYEVPRNELLIPEAAPLLQEAWQLLPHLTGRRDVMFEEGARLQQRLAPLAQEHGIHLLRGRLMERFQEQDDDRPGAGITGIRRRLHFAFRTTMEDSGHCLDRSHEPLEWSDEEEAYFDHGDTVAGWLEWEGKDRLLCWDAK